MDINHAILSKLDQPALAMMAGNIVKLLLEKAGEKLSKEYFEKKYKLKDFTFKSHSKPFILDFILSLNPRSVSAEDIQRGLENKSKIKEQNNKLKAAEEEIERLKRELAKAKNNNDTNKII